MKVDITIVGGGIAGLWSLARLRQLGFRVILIENNSLGGEQSCASQGIIHGGTKYALKGVLSRSALSIQAMPQIWRDCLEGHGELDLSAVKILSQHQYLWTSSDIGTQLTGFFASKLMQSKMQLLSEKDYPDFFLKQLAETRHQQNVQFSGKVYQLNEPVVNTQQLISTLAAQNKDAIFKLDTKKIRQNPDKSYSLTSVNNIQIDTQCLIFAAGNQNRRLHEICQQNNKQSLLGAFPAMQQRPLQMVMLKGEDLPRLYAHRLGIRSSPLLTITSHQQQQSGERIWYLGGEISEKYTDLPAEDLINIAKKELAHYMPWVSLENTQWSTLKINRAEPATKNGLRPDNPYSVNHQNIITAWPVKLTMTPMMVDHIIHLIKNSKIESRKDTKFYDSLASSVLADYQRYDICDFPWDKEVKWFDYS